MDDIISKESLNCPVNNHRIKSLEEGMVDMKEDISNIKNQNGIQNELLTQIKTVVDFILEDRKEQKEFNKRQLGTLEEITKTQMAMQSGLEKVIDDVEDIKEKQKTQDDNSNINWMLLVKNSLTKLIGGIIFGSLIIGGIFALSKIL